MTFPFRDLGIVAILSIAILFIMLLLGAGEVRAETMRCSVQANNPKTSDIIHFYIEYNIRSNFSVRIYPSSDTNTYSQENFWQNGSIFHYDTALIAPYPNTEIQIIQTGGSFRGSSCVMGINWIEPVIDQGPSPGVAHWPVDEETKAVFRIWEQDAINMQQNIGAAMISTGTIGLGALYLYPPAAPWIGGVAGLFSVIGGSARILEKKYHDLAIDPEDQNCYAVYDPPVLSIDELNAQYGTNMQYSDGTDPDGSGVMPWYTNNMIEILKGLERKLEGAYGSMNRGLTCNVDWQFSLAADYLHQAGDDAAVLSAWHSNLFNYFYSTPAWNGDLNQILWDGVGWYQGQADYLHAR